MPGVDHDRQRGCRGERATARVQDGRRPQDQQCRGQIAQFEGRNRQQRTQQSGLAQPGELELETSRHGAVVLARFSCGSNNRKRGKGAGDSGASV